MRYLEMEGHGGESPLQKVKATTNVSRNWLSSPLIYPSLLLLATVNGLLSY